MVKYIVDTDRDNEILHYFFDDCHLFSLVIAGRYQETLWLSLYQALIVANG